MRHRRLFLIALAVFTLSVSAAAAQDTPAVTEEPAVTEAPVSGEAVVTGPSVATELNNPRHIFFADDGTLYIAEAGQSRFHRADQRRRPGWHKVGSRA